MLLVAALTLVACVTIPGRDPVTGDIRVKPGGLVGAVGTEPGLVPAPADGLCHGDEPDAQHTCPQRVPELP